MKEKEKYEFPLIEKWFDLEKEIENVKILNSIQFAMFMFYRKSFRRYKLMHNDYDFNESEEEVQNEIVKLNFGLEKVLYSITEDINKLITNESSIMNIDFCEEFRIKAFKCEFLEVAVIKMNENMKQNSIGMLSPAAASLDQFKSYAHRGEEFKKNVYALS